MMAEKTPKIIYDFNKNSDMRDWVVVDDGVMGGVSYGSIRLDKSGNGLYRGYISLDNYGGFSSIRLRQRETNVDRYKYLVIGLYGDNKYYQFRVKSKYYDRHVYGYKFFAIVNFLVVEIFVLTNSTSASLYNFLIKLLNKKDCSRTSK